MWFDISLDVMKCFSPFALPFYASLPPISGRDVPLCFATVFLRSSPYHSLTYKNVGWVASSYLSIDEQHNI